MAKSKATLDQVATGSGGQTVRTQRTTRRVRSKRTDSPQLRCTYEGCTKVCMFPSQLKSHMISHLPREERELPCKEKGCNFRAGTKYTLKAHVKRIHPWRVPRLQCAAEGCTFVAADNFNLRKHFVECHFSDQAACTVRDCDYKHASRETLRTHLFRVHGHMTVTGTCLSCRTHTRVVVAPSTMRALVAAWVKAGGSLHSEAASASSPSVSRSHRTDAEAREEVPRYTPHPEPYIPPPPPSTVPRRVLKKHMRRKRPVAVGSITS